MPRLQGPDCLQGRGRAREKHQLRALWLLTGLIFEVVSYDLGMTLQTPLRKPGPAFVRASPLNPNRTLERWARSAENSKGDGSLWCLGVFGAVLPLCSGASVWTGCFQSGGGKPRVIAVSGKFL